MDELLQDFLTESLENMSVLDNQLLKLELEPNNKDLLANIFRMVHTVKGTCGFIGLPALEKVAHAGENVLGKIRDGEAHATSETVTLILECLDTIKSILLHLEATQEEPTEDYTSLITRLEQAAKKQSAPSLATTPSDQSLKKQEASSKSNKEKLPKTEQPAESSSIKELAETSESATDIKPVDTAQESSLVTQSVRVTIDMLENLMTMVSELVLTRNQLLQMVRQIPDSEFAGPLQRLSLITTELQESVMKTRMQPIGNAWSKLPRLVHDLSKGLKKKIELDMVGAETELDRQILELIKDPLTHMVRNAADHGIEQPVDRIKANKKETGTIHLNAYHEGGHIVIEITDDGKGLNLTKIKEKIVTLGLATEAELENFTENQIYNFIFKPGFSTAAQVTNFSGRGVGMDVVRTNIEKIGGTVDMRSREGVGTSFLIKIPLTLAIVSALIVETEGQRFAIPQIGVVELVRTSKKSHHKIEYINEVPFLRLRDHLLPLVSLARVLHIESDTSTPALESDVFVVVVQTGTYTFGIMVDRVFDAQEIVVKPLAPLLKSIRLFSGNTILGDGEVVMILDLSGMALQVGEIDTHDHSLQQYHEATSNPLTETISLLLFKAGEGAPKAIPLALISRLEEVSQANIEYSNGKAVIQYRGRLMPILPINPAHHFTSQRTHSVLVFSDRERVFGLVVETIIDIVEDEMNIKLKSSAPGCFGSAVISGKMTDIIDADYYITQIFPDWFALKRKGQASHNHHILFVEDSAFFRNILTPVLKNAGYKVTSADHGAKALELCEQESNHFDLILTDIEMPIMDGFTFTKTLKDMERWKKTPIIALSAHASPADLGRARSIGFFDYISKLDRDHLLDTLEQALNSTRSIAA